MEERDVFLGFSLSAYTDLLFVQDLITSWILGFGRFVRVMAPSALADWVEKELDQARQQYVDGAGMAVVDPDLQPGLPFLFSRISSA